MNKNMRKEILTYMEELAEEFGLCLFVIRKEKEKCPNMVTVLFYHFPSPQMIAIMRFDLKELNPDEWRNSARLGLLERLRFAGI